MAAGRKISKLLVPVLILAALGGALWVGLGMRGTPTDNLDLVGFVDGDIIRLAAKVPGRVDKVPVQDGSVVKAGDAIASLEREDFQLAVDRAEAALGSARARVVEAERTLAYQRSLSESQICQARAGLDVAQESLKQQTESADLAKKEYDRSAELLKNQVGTPQDFDRRSSEWRNAQIALVAAQAQVREKEAALRLAEATREQVKLREAEIDTSQRLVREAEVAVEQARLDLRNSVTVAPVPGTILTRSTLPGEIVQVRSPIASLVNLDVLWIAVDIEESFAANLKLGDEVEVRLPSLPERPLPGKVIYIAQQSDFATQRDIGRNKVDVKTFRIKIAVDNAERLFKVGMTARVRVPLRHGNGT